MRSFFLGDIKRLVGWARFLLSEFASSSSSSTVLSLAPDASLAFFIFLPVDFFSASSASMLNELMTRRALSVPFTPQRNGQVERFFYTLVRHTRRPAGGKWPL